ncbi:MAG: phosphoribosyltransferase family protein, partial [Rikenellaceae bacterium]
TKPQSSLLHNYDRKDNMRGAFEVIDSSIFSDKHILIVDDVSTTGETISAFVKTLRKRYKHININVATLSATKGC